MVEFAVVDDFTGRCAWDGVGGGVPRVTLRFGEGRA